MFEFQQTYKTETIVLNIALLNIHNVLLNLSTLSHLILTPMTSSATRAYMPQLINDAHQMRHSRCVGRIRAGLSTEACDSGRRGSREGLPGGFVRHGGIRRHRPIVR